MTDKEKMKDLEKTVEGLQLILKSRNDLVKELKAQIEKMKNCFNCKKCTGGDIELNCENMSLWEIVE